MELGVSGAWKMKICEAPPLNDLPDVSDAQCITVLITSDVGFRECEEAQQMFVYKPDTHAAGETYEKMVLPVLSPDPNTDETRLRHSVRWPISSPGGAGELTKTSGLPCSKIPV